MEDKEQVIYELWAKTKGFARQVRQARATANKGLEVMSAPYISMSFGKDSTVLVHLLKEMKPDLPIMHVRLGYGDGWPDTERVKQSLIDRFAYEFIELPGLSIIDVYRDVGLYVQDEETSKETRSAQRAFGKSLGDILDREAHKRGFDGAFMGLRKEESDNRARLFSMRGSLYFAKTRQLWACHPLAYWSARDVWAYIVAYDLPYNELYDLDPQGRERARLGAMFGTRSARYGRLKFLQMMYPDFFNHFAAEFPEIRCYV